jgi:hypothetical protein
MTYSIIRNCQKSWWSTNIDYRTDKKENKFSSYIRKFRMKQLQSHIWLTTSSYMGKYLHLSSYIRKPFLIYDFATAPLWISLYCIEGKFIFIFYQCAETRKKSKFFFVSTLPAPRCRSWYKAGLECPASSSGFIFSTASSEWSGSCEAESRF